MDVYAHEYFSIHKGKAIYLENMKVQFIPIYLIVFHIILCQLEYLYMINDELEIEAKYT